MMTWQRIAAIGAFLATAVALGFAGHTEMASAALGIAGGATLPAKLQ